jgi:hypothetical protein
MALHRWRTVPIWLILAAGAAALLAGWVILRPPSVTGDSFALLHGARSVQRCLEAGVSTGCEFTGSPTQRGVAPYPLYQYIPGFAFVVSGLGDADALKGFALLNLAGVVGTLALVVHTGRSTGRDWVAPLLVTLVLASPLVWYAWSTFGEGLATFLIAAFCAGALLRVRPVALVALLLAAGMTKETIAPLLVGLGAAALAGTPIARRPLQRGHWIALLGGGVLVLAVNAAFNLFRYDQLTNLYYSTPESRTPGLLLKLKFAVSVWVAPNGGVFANWPLMVLLVLGLLWAVLASVRRASRSPRSWLPGVAVIVVLLLQTGVCAAWYAPFGWIAWGPRLIMPVLPAAVTVGVLLYLDAFERAIGWVRRRRWAVVAVTTVIIAGLIPQVGALHASSRVGAWFTPRADSDHCPPSIPAPPGSGQYYRCIIDGAWRKTPLVWDAAAGAKTTGGVLWMLVFGTAVVSMIAAVRPVERKGEAGGPRPAVAMAS